MIIIDHQPLWTSRPFSSAGKSAIIITN